MSKNPSPVDPTGPDKIEATKGPADKIKTPPNAQAFQSYMEEPGAKGEAGKASGAMTPMELSKGSAQPPGTPTRESLLGQVDHAQNTLQTLQENFRKIQNLQEKAPNPIRFPRAQQTLLTDQLQEINTYIRSAAEKAGAKPPPLTTPTKGMGVLEKFLTYVTDGQNQLVSAKKELDTLSATGTQLRPTDFLLVQAKLAQAQQLIEYSSVVLSNVVKAIQQTLGIQIS